MSEQKWFTLSHADTYIKWPENTCSRCNTKTTRVWKLRPDTPCYCTDCLAEALKRMGEEDV